MVRVRNELNGGYIGRSCVLGINLGSEKVGGGWARMWENEAFLLKSTLTAFSGVEEWHGTYGSGEKLMDIERSEDI